MKHILKVRSIENVTHDVKCIRVDKPAGYEFIPGQASEVAIRLAGWEDEKRPFTFTSLNRDPYLEFTIKCYPRNGVTQQIAKLKPGDELIVEDAWGAIEYQGEGYFIAGGAGITPFIAILRQLHKEGNAKGNKLFFSNKTARDIIYENELKEMLGDDAIFIITDEESKGYMTSFIDEAFLNSHIKDYSKQFYICGPDPMIQSISKIVVEKGTRLNAVVFEK